MLRRIGAFRLVCVASVTMLIGILFFLQIIRGNHYATQARESRVRTISVEGARGLIVDRYGRILAGTSLMYEVSLTPSDVQKTQLNQSIYAALVILDNAGVAPACTIPIIWENNAYTYTQSDISVFLSEQKLSLDCAADDAVAALVDRYGVQDIPKEAHLMVLAVRLQLSQQSYRAYKPVRLALFADATLCAQFAENSIIMPGITCKEVPVRVYPNGTLFCHGLGYLGKISAEDADSYTQKGYDIYTDIVGKSGLEAQYEQVLHPTAGEVTVSVDSTGHRNAVLSQTPAQDGETVVLTLDASLQAVAEQTLESTMSNIRSGAYGESFSSASIGAVVAIDVQSSEVLAMASVPSYDPNLFLQTLDEETWQVLNPTYLTTAGETNRDPTLPRPLINNAIVNAFAPGSMFKPVTALAALEKQVVTAEEFILAKGRYTYFSEVDAPACWIWNEHHTTHGLVNMQKALAVSCNYYFYEMGVRTGSESLADMARRLGLGEKTGIGLLGEADGTLDSQALCDTQAVKQTLANMRTILPGVDEVATEKAIWALLLDPSPSMAKELFEPLGFNAAQSLSLYQSIDLIRWRPSRILAAAIGQGDTTVTVVQMANAVAAITQNGLRHTPRLVLSLPDSTGDVSSVVASEAFLNASYVHTVMSGMEEAVRSGTASSAFDGCKLSVAAKTGTAQSTGRDAFAWFLAYAPADNPRIAVAVMIAQGGHGSYAAPVARAVLEAYFAPGEATDARAPQALIP